MATHRVTGYTAITSEGGLLSQEALASIAALGRDRSDLAPETYGPYRNPGELTAAINQAWAAIQIHWQSFARSRQHWAERNSTGVPETRQFVQNVLYELGYGPLAFHREAETINGRSYVISHRASTTENATPIHIVSANQSLDRSETRGSSPGATMQGYLNAADQHLWGIVTNGLQFRLLRENRQIDRILRIEFDLEEMISQENFSEFRVMWLVLHATRFVKPGEPRESAIIEQWTKSAREQGDRALDHMRTGVEQAITALANGLLGHPANDELRTNLRDGHLTPASFYRQILRLVYRLLFLMVAEERDLLFPPATDADAIRDRQRLVQRYMRLYSVERLRQLAMRRRHAEPHQTDLWRGLLTTFLAMRDEGKAAHLGLKPLGGGLFDSASCRQIDGEDVTTEPMIANDILLNAIRALSVMERDGVRRRINYRDLDAEELGSVYESLLDQEFQLKDLPGGRYQMEFATSGERKSTGSYYTPRSLVQELLNSALDPVMDAAIAKLKTAADTRKALLDLNIIDPACGSGHFLLGAARRIGRRIAELDAGDGIEPELAAIRHHTREAIRHCIYGVDKNALAIDLCKVALWMESHEPGAPIGFLDHHIKRGDSLVGVFKPDMLRGGIPDDAYKALTGDDTSAANDLKKRNRTERSKATSMEVEGGGWTTARQGDLFTREDETDLVAALTLKMNEIEAMPDDSLTHVQAKARAYATLQTRDDWREMTIACDLWTYAFFAPKVSGRTNLVPTSATVHRVMVDGSTGVHGQMIGAARGAAEDTGYFHWWLTFPEVMIESRGGFDCVLGNPPWERVKLQEKEFFASRSEAIAKAPNKAARDRLIKALAQSDPPLLRAFRGAQKEAESASQFMRTSGRYPLTGGGDVNLYSIFAEHDSQLINPSGRAGVIVPTGIATDDTNKRFFAWLVDKGRLASLLDFENRRKIFPAIASYLKFVLMTVQGDQQTKGRFIAGFFLLDPAELQDPDKTFILTAEDIALLNPNTKTCPIFRSERDAELTKAIYRVAPVLINENLPEEEGNPWGVRFKTMFHMSSDSHLFRTREDLEALGARLDPDGHWRKDGEEWLPLYEAKLIHQYDYRFATYQPDGSTRNVTDAEHRDPSFVISARYWIQESRVTAVAQAAGKPITTFRNIARASDMRTAISTIIPYSAIGDTLPTILGDSNLRHLLIANLNSTVLDFVARQKVGGAHLTFFVAKQFPMLTPQQYSGDWSRIITDRVLRLTYTAHDMAPFARDLGYDGPPFAWDEDERAQLRADLDGIYAHLYGISRDDFAHILDTFPIVRRNDIARYGEYRTKRLCLAAYDHFAPETLRKLENRVRDMEIGLRRLIVDAAGDDPSVLPSGVREGIVSTMGEKGGDASTGSLRSMLEYSSFTNLEKIIRTAPVWAVVGSRFASKSEMERVLGSISKLRNPLAHARALDEETRQKGESALAWLEERVR